jgi:hypothetical protein
MRGGKLAKNFAQQRFEELTAIGACLYLVDAHPHCGCERLHRREICAEIGINAVRQNVHRPGAPKKCRYAPGTGTEVLNP